MIFNSVTIVIVFFYFFNTVYFIYKIYIVKYIKRVFSMSRLQSHKFRWIVRIEEYDYYYVRGEPMGISQAMECARDLAGLMQLTKKKYSIFIQTVKHDQTGNNTDSIPG